MAKKKADKKVDKVKDEELEEVIDLEEYDEDEDLDEEFDMEEEIEEDEAEESDNPEEVTLEDRVIAIEKKVNVVLALSVLVAILSIATMCVVIFGGGNTKEKAKETETSEQGQQKEQQQNYEYDVSAFKEVKAKELSSLSKGKTILVYIGRDTCGYCIQFVPILTQIQEKYNKYTTYYIDIAKIYDYANGVVLDEEAESIMVNFKTVDAYKDMMKQDFGSTPMTLVIKDNKIIDGIVGYVDANTLDSLVKDNGLNK